MLRGLLVVGSALVFGAFVAYGRSEAPSPPRGPTGPAGVEPPVVAARPTVAPTAGGATGPAARTAPVPESPLVLRRALDGTMDVESLPAPGPLDWLANHDEEGQTYEEWRVCRRHAPDARRTTIRLLPLGDLGRGDFPSIEVLASYAETFFGMPARPVEGAGAPPTFAARRNPHTGRPQILTTDVLDWLAKDLPRDAFCVLALTTTDLYPEPAWNYVFGQASFFDRTGVFSFARYDPAFDGSKRDASTPLLVLRRALKVMTHEIGHMFGLEHCVRARCLMNGVNHLGEADATPMDVCPVCLAKLHHAIRFDVLARERALEAWRRSHGLVEEADRCAARIARWTAPAPR